MIKYVLIHYVIVDLQLYDVSNEVENRIHEAIFDRNPGMSNIKLLRNRFTFKNNIFLRNRFLLSIEMKSFRKIKIVLWKNILENYNLYFSKLY